MKPWSTVSGCICPSACLPKPCSGTWETPHSTQFSGGVHHCSSKTSGGENLEVQQPVSCWDYSSLDFHPALPRMLGATLIGDQVVQVGEPREKRLLAPVGMMEVFHHEQLAVEGVMGLIQQGAGHRHPGVFQHRIPAGFLLVKPA